ncbi:MAG: type II toxin-antitoxin system prevent-host-death family antitoxin [Patescibacteria group bacterium]|nr:type II toxin-antitoxin system prevent-host-death family antitoxin [Patescibacteria group bacterium]
MRTKAMNSNIVALKDLRLNMEKYIKMVEKGHSFIVVKKSTPVFKVEPVDPWGDEGTWTTIADFSSYSVTGGIPIDELIKKLEAAK